jgi:hypothetical protein
MGRPIKKRFINTGSSTNASGGESVASLAVHGGNNYSAGTTIAFPAPGQGGGSTATATITFVAPTAGLTGNGNIASVTLTSAGGGYLVRNIEANVTFGFNKPANVVVDGFTQIAGNVFKFSSGVTSGIFAGMVANVFFTTTAFGNPTRVVSVGTASGNITFSTANTAAITSPISFGDVGFNGNVVLQIFPTVTQGNTIQGNAFITSGAGGRVCDILRQKGSRRYRVTNDQGTDVVRLVPTGINGNEEYWSINPTVANVTSAGGPVSAGQMTIQATDSAGGTYWVGKLEGQTALVFPGGTGTPGTQFTANTHVIWSMNAAVVDTTVKLATND